MRTLVHEGPNAIRSIETTRVHDAARRRGDRVAARGPRAAAGAACPDRIPGAHIRFRACICGTDAFLAGLSDLGYVEGRNIHIEFRFAEGDEDRLPALAAELVALNVDVIVTYATGVYAAQRATTKIPIVFAATGDVVAMGLVSSLAHPGGNVTGLTFFLPEIMAKRLELLKEVMPSMTRAGVLLLRGNPSSQFAEAAADKRQNNSTSASAFPTPPPLMSIKRASCSW
jgi:hypothetical protein